MLIWVIFTIIIFKFNDQSALERIYLGSGNKFLSHLSLKYYYENLFNLLKLNKIIFIYLTISYILLILRNIKELKNLILLSLLLFSYILFFTCSNFEISCYFRNSLFISFNIYILLPLIFHLYMLSGQKFSKIN